MTKPLPSHIQTDGPRERTGPAYTVRTWRRTLLATAMTAAVGIAGATSGAEAQQAYYRGQAQLGESVVVDYSVLEQLGQPQTYPDLVRPGQTARGTTSNFNAPPPYPPTSTTLPLANAPSNGQSGQPLPPPSDAPKSRVLLPGASNSATPQPAQPQPAQQQTAQSQTGASKPSASNQSQAIATRPSPAPAKTELADEIKAAEKPEPRTDDGAAGGGNVAAAKPKPATPPAPATEEIARAEPAAAPKPASEPTPKPAAAPKPAEEPEAASKKEADEPSAAPTPSVESAAIPKPAKPPAPALETIEADEASGTDAANSQAVKDVKKEYETLLAEAGSDKAGDGDTADAISPPDDVDTPNAAPKKAEAPQPAQPESTNETDTASQTASTGDAAAGNGEVTATQTAAIDPNTFIARADGLSVLFEGDGTDLPEGVKGQLDKLAADIKQQDDARIKLMGYSEQIGDLASQPRRVSLFRTLSVRSYLMNKGISSRQINVQALGANLPDDGPKNRVDIEVQK